MVSEKEFICPICGCSSTEKEWNDNTKEYYEDPITPINNKDYDTNTGRFIGKNINYFRPYVCPQCNEIANNSEIMLKVSDHMVHCPICKNHNMVFAATTVALFNIDRNGELGDPVGKDFYDINKKIMKENVDMSNLKYYCPNCGATFDVVFDKETSRLKIDWVLDDDD